jgi:hypothetical protein
MNKQEKEDFTKQIKEKFEEAKKELGFKSNFKDIDEIFFITDHIFSEGFVSNNFSRQMCSRIRDTLNVWINYLHSLIMPNPQYLINITEARLFDEDERKEIQKLIKGALALSSANTLAGLTKDKKTEAEFIDGSVKYWNEKFKPGITKVMKKVNKGWSE